MHPIDVRGESVYYSAPDSLGFFVKDGPDDRIQRLALDQRHQGTPVALADLGVTFPVTEAPFAFNNGRAIINRDLIGKGATPTIDAIAFAPDLLTTQESIQVTT